MNDQKHTPKYTRQGTPGDTIGVADLFSRFAKNEDPVDGFSIDIVDDHTIVVVNHDEASKVATFYVADLFEPYYRGVRADTLADLCCDVDELSESTKEIEESARLVEKQASTLKRRQAHLALVARHLRLIDCLKHLVDAAHAPRCITADDIAHVTVFARRIVDQVPA